MCLWGSNVPIHSVSFEKKERGARKEETTLDHRHRHAERRHRSWHSLSLTSPSSLNHEHQRDISHLLLCRATNDSQTEQDQALLTPVPTRLLMLHCLLIDGLLACCEHRKGRSTASLPLSHILTLACYTCIFFTKSVFRRSLTNSLCCSWPVSARLCT